MSLVALSCRGYSICRCGFHIRLDEPVQHADLKCGEVSNKELDMV